MAFSQLNDSLAVAYAKASTMESAPKSDPLDLFTAPTYGGYESQNGFRTVSDLYEHNCGRVYSAIQVSARRTANQPLFVGRIEKASAGERSLLKARTNGRDIQVSDNLKSVSPDNIRLLDEHPLVQSFDNPNRLMTRWALLNMSVMNLMVTGRVCWIISVMDGMMQFTPIPTTWATPKHGKRPFEAWNIRPPGSMDKPLTIPDEFMFHVYFPDPSSPLRPLSPVQVLSRAILADEAISTAQHVGFRNGITPTVALIAGDAAVGGVERPIKLEKHQREQLVNWMRQEYQGVQRHGLPIILDALIRDVKPLYTKPMEMAFLESSQLTESQIFMGMGVNPISAGKVEDVNRASSAQAEHHLVFNAINPVIDLLTQGIQKDIVPLFDDKGLTAWIPPIRPNDPELRMRQMAVGMKNGAVLRNEYRRELNLPPMENGDTVPLNVNTMLYGEQLRKAIRREVHKVFASLKEAA